jgi:hypothetical protein
MKGLKELIEKGGALVTRTCRDSFSIFSIYRTETIQLFPDTGRTIQFPRSPIEAAEGAYPLYDPHNDVIWVIGRLDDNEYSLAKYQITADNWTCDRCNSPRMRRRSGWAQLCLPTHANLVYVVGGDDQADKSSIDVYDVLSDDWKTIYFETPLFIPPKVMIQHQTLDIGTMQRVDIKSVTNWRQFKFVVALFDGEILFIGGDVDVDYQQVTYNVINFTYKLITSYNPITTKRTLVTVLPTSRQYSTPFIIL